MEQIVYTMGDAGVVLVMDGVKVGNYSSQQPTSEYFQVSLDEVSIIHQTRMEDWLRLDYEFQRLGSMPLTSAVSSIEKPGQESS